MRGSCDLWSLCALRSVIFLVLFGCDELAAVSLNFRFVCVEILRFCMHFSLSEWPCCDHFEFIKCCIVLDVEFAQYKDVNV